MALLYLFLKVALLAVLMTCLTPLKYSIKKSYAIIVVGNIFIWLLNFLVYELKGLIFLDRVFLLTATLPAFICFSVVAEYKGFKVLFSLLTVSIFGTLNAFISFLPVLIFKDYSSNYIFTGVFNSLLFVLMIVLIIKVFRKPYFRMLDVIKTGWERLCLIPVLLLAIIFLLQYYPTPVANRTENVPILFLVYILMFAFYFIIYRNYENITQYYQLEQDKKLMLLQTEMQKKEYEATLDKLNSAQIYRHDIRHHINALNMMFDENNINGARNYLDKLSNRMDSTVIEKYCENHVVNVILSTYINRAREENISVSCEANISDGLKTEDPDLWSIFSNALENAIKACKMIEDCGNRKISIDCREHSGHIYIQISNTFSGDIIFDGEYPVSQQKGHGFGTRSIAAIAEKYDGIFSFAVEDGLFVTTVILNPSR